MRTLIAILIYSYAYGQDVRLERTYIALNAMDLITTIYALEHGAVEVNPIMKNRTYLEMTAIKTVSVASVVILHRINPNDKVARGVMIGLNIFYGLVITNNISIILRL